MAVSEQLIQALSHETLLVHGRDDQVIPTATSLRLLELIDRAQLHVFGPVWALGADRTGDAVQCPGPWVPRRVSVGLGEQIVRDLVEPGVTAVGVAVLVDAVGDELPQPGVFVGP